MNRELREAVEKLLRAEDAFVYSLEHCLKLVRRARTTHSRDEAMESLAKVECEIHTFAPLFAAVRRQNEIQFLAELQSQRQERADRETTA